MNIEDKAQMVIDKVASMLQDIVNDANITRKEHHEKVWTLCINQANLLFQRDAINIANAAWIRLVD